MPMSNTVGWDMTNKQTVMGGWGGLNKQQRNKQSVVYDKQTSGRRARTNKQIHIGGGGGGGGGVGSQSVHDVHNFYRVHHAHHLHSFTRMFTHSLVRSLVCSLVHRTFTRLFNRSPYVRSFTFTFIVCSHSRSPHVHIHVHRMFAVFTVCLSVQVFPVLPSIYL